MFFHTDIKGDRLPPKTLCLTYDDGPGATPGAGPGPRTEELGHYLYEKSIPAAFFVIGRHAEACPDVLCRLRDWGHLIGNHTYSHEGLVRLAERGGDVAEEVARADPILRPYTPGHPVLFRPPFGDWRERVRPGADERKPTSIVAELLNRSGRLADYVGPIKWEIVGEDWHCWRMGLSLEESRDRHLHAVERHGRGIVLLHDSSDEDDVRPRNRTYELTRTLVPILKDRGYRFVRVDAIPQVQSAMRVRFQLMLRAADGRFLVRSGGGERITAEESTQERAEGFGVVPLEGTCVALRAGNGQYLSAPPMDDAVLASAAMIGPWEVLDMEELGHGRVLLRTSDGEPLEVGAGDLRRGRATVFEAWRLFSA